MTWHPCLRCSSQSKRSFGLAPPLRTGAPVHDGMKPVVFCVERVEEEDG